MTLQFSGQEMRNFKFRWKKILLCTEKGLGQNSRSQIKEEPSSLLCETWNKRSACWLYSIKRLLTLAPPSYFFVKIVRFRGGGRKKNTACDWIYRRIMPNGVNFCSLTSNGMYSSIKHNFRASKNQSLLKIWSEEPIKAGVGATAKPPLLPKTNLRKG